jgi:hypothetical protein
MPRFEVKRYGDLWTVKAEDATLKCDEVQFNVASVAKGDGTLEAFGTIREQHRGTQRVLIISEF